MSDADTSHEPVPETPESAAPPAAQPVPVPGETTPDDRTMAMLAHLLGIITLFLGPLIVWLIKKDASSFVDDQGKEAVNFQIGMTGAWVISAGIGCIPILGLVSCALWPALFVVNVVFCILAGVAANRGEQYRYPIAIRLIK